VKLVGDVTSGPPSVLVIITPVVAPVGTVTTIIVAKLLVAATGCAPVKATILLDGLESKPVPYMVICVPAEAPTEEKPVIVLVGVFPHPERIRIKQTSAPIILKYLNMKTSFHFGIISAKHILTMCRKDGLKKDFW
jgi:hypothetical protein